MLPLVATIVVLGCVAASFRHLAFALAPTTLDPAALGTALRGAGGRARLLGLTEAVRRTPDAVWEQAVFESATRPAEERVALLNEQLQELDWRLRRWARVPRVCASIATSSGFLLATVALREGLVGPTEGPIELQDLAMRTAMTHAIDVAAIGLAGAAFCIAIQYHARRTVKERAAAADKLVERLETLGP